MLLRGLLFFILFWVIARAFWNFVDGVVRGASAPPPPAGGRAGRAPVAVKMAPCPGCGTYVVPGKAISASSAGHTLYFCSDRCRVEYASR